MRAEKGQEKHSVLLAQPPGPVGSGRGKFRTSLRKFPSHSRELSSGNHGTGVKRATGLKMR